MSLEAKREAAARQLEEFVEDYSGEDGLLEAAKNDNGVVTKSGINDRLKALVGEPDSDDERAALMLCLELVQAETEASKAVKRAKAALDAKVHARYGKLTEAEIKTLVIGDKWNVAIQTMLASEVQRLAQALAGRIEELEERYATILPELEQEVDDLSQRVEAHLKQMGLVWT